jgi:hypothetical protein
LVKVIEELKEYLDLTLGLHVKVKPWRKQDELPFFLADLYDFYEIALLKNVCVLMLAKGKDEITPSAIEKHKQEIEKKGAGKCIYVHQSISPYNRARLIQHHTSFIIPGNQMYLPEFGIDLREHFKLQKKHGKYLSPAAQITIIYVLIKGIPKKLTPSMLAKHLGYSIMSINRAFAEFNAAKIGEVRKEGRELFWTISNRKELWAETKKIMRSPVKNRIWLKKIASLKNFKVFSGLSALSYYSLLNPPSLPTYALSSNILKNLKLSKDEILPFSDGAAAEIEIWQYDPLLLRQDKYVDPFSLYLSLEGSGNERVEMALEQMMENIKW